MPPPSGAGTGQSQGQLAQPRSQQLQAVQQQRAVAAEQQGLEQLQNAAAAKLQADYAKRLREHGPRTFRWPDGSLRPERPPPNPHAVVSLTFFQVSPQFAHNICRSHFALPSAGPRACCQLPAALPASTPALPHPTLGPPCRPTGGIVRPLCSTAAHTAATERTSERGPRCVTALGWPTSSTLPTLPL